jgi:hypothetical protein
MQGLLIACAAFVVAWLWMDFFAPLLARIFGVPARLGLWRSNRRNQHLSRPQFVWWIGVVGFGIGMFLWSLICDESTIFQTYPGVTARRFVVNMFIWLFAGFGFGLSTAPRHSDPPSSV